MLPRFRHTAAALLVAGGLALATAPAAGEVFLLAGGGQIEGEWLNREVRPRKEYVVRTTSGVTITLQARQVRQFSRANPAEDEYDQIAPGTPDTVEGHWKLAEWCREKRLAAHRRRHLERIIELDWHHQKARSLLGYAFIGGQWVTQEGHRRQAGYEFYRGRWRRPQEIELLEARSKRDLLQKEWLAKMQRWRKMLDSDHASVAEKSFRSIQDPLAVVPLTAMFRRERVRSVKYLYLDVLANIDTGPARQFLHQTTFSDPDLEVFYYCLKRLAARKTPRLIEDVVLVLQDPNNERVNRAAVALERLNDRRAVAPLIEALITVHQRRLPGKLSPDATAASFSADGNSSFIQNEAPQIQIVRVQNQQVLSALTSLTGTTFGFDQKAWRYWYNQELQAEARAGTSTLSRQE